MDKRQRKAKLKQMIEKLHAGEPMQKVKEEFADVLDGVDPKEIAELEQELVDEGMPRERLLKLCDIHMLVFKDQLGKFSCAPPEGHPANILMQEHALMLEFSEGLKKATAKGKPKPEEMEHFVKHIKDSEKHYVREENVLFPMMEKHGISEPPQVMWMEHDQIRGIKKELYAQAERFLKQKTPADLQHLHAHAANLAQALSNHFMKENTILFPMAMQVLDELEWADVRRQFDEIGYCCFTPEPPAMEGMDKPAVKSSAEPSKGEINFETGHFTPTELEAVLDTLPIDMTFVSKDEVVKYFSNSKDRIFARTKAIIGRKVQNCHPQKSVHVVEKILDDFRTGKREKAEFWIHMGEKYIMIRYFAVRDKKGNYLGCLEVSQDLAPLQKITGDKRLLDD